MDKLAIRALLTCASVCDSHGTGQVWSGSSHMRPALAQQMAHGLSPPYVPPLWHVKVLTSGSSTCSSVGETTQPRRAGPSLWT